MSYTPNDIQKNRTTGLKKINQGGTITRNGQTTVINPSAAAASNGELGSGLINPPAPKGGVVRRTPPAPQAPAPSVPPPQPALAPALKPTLPPSQPAAIQPALNAPGAPIASPTTAAAPQTEGANPLTGDGNAQAGGTTDKIDPAQKLGFSQRGPGVPHGQDAAPGNTGGTGLYKRTFSNPKSASVYDQYIKKIFPDSNP